LVQERVARDRHYPWRVLVCCALLNRTGRSQVRPMFEALFGSCRTPADAAGADLASLLKPLGLQNRRAETLRRLSADYAAGKPPQDCHGVGRYAMDAWAIFVEGRTDVRPSDHFLRPYLAWRKKHGTGIEWG
jgi:methyl-CpG-binding domain protein 4